MSEEKKKFSLSPKQKSALTHALAIILSLLAASLGMPMLADLGKVVEVVAPALEADTDAKPEAVPEAPAAPADTAAPVAPPAEEKAPEAAPA